MPNENEILPLQSDFEQIKKTNADGRNFWSARELSPALGYSTYQKFSRLLDKSMVAAQAKGMNLADHFNRVVEMVKPGSGALYASGELSESATIRKIGIVQNEGEREAAAVIRKIGITANDGKNYDTNVYNLDAIIAVGNLINSYRPTKPCLKCFLEQ